MALDRQTRDAITAAVTSTIAETMEMYQERWLTTSELCEHFGMFTEDWLKKYGHKLPRERLEIRDDNGNLIRASRWAYPMHKIQRWINERSNVNITL